ncbi:MAG: C-GCAxxG-C-C family protein [Actinomycetota bacterium]|nr:C-GCAxxG-C-C family protein [Actinomycetota bacterium]
MNKTQLAPADTLTTPCFAGASELAETAFLRGKTLYEEGMFCCEAVLSVVNEAAGTPFPPDVMRLGSGFWGGLAGDGSTCGALVGSIMAIGLLAGRTATNGEWESCTDASEEIRTRFREACGGVSCGGLVRPFGGMDGEGRRGRCAEITGTASALVIALAEERGWL